MLLLVTSCIKTCYNWAALQEDRTSGIPTRSNTNWAVHPQKIVRGFKFRIYKEEGMFYPSNENNGADQSPWSWSAS